MILKRKFSTFPLLNPTEIEFFSSNEKRAPRSVISTFSISDVDNKRILILWFSRLFKNYYSLSSSLKVYSKSIRLMSVGWVVFVSKHWLYDLRNLEWDDGKSFVWCCQEKHPHPHSKFGMLFFSQSSMNVLSQETNKASLVTIETAVCAFLLAGFSWFEQGKFSMEKLHKQN